MTSWLSQRQRAVAAVLLLATHAHAESTAALPEPANSVAPLQRTRETAAEQLFHTARAHMLVGRYTEACPELVESQRLDPAIGTLLNLGYCYEQAGSPARARMSYLAAAALARSLGERERESFALAASDALGNKLARLRLHAPHMLPALAATVDEEPLKPEAWGKVLEVDPGTHTLVLSAPGYRPATVRVDVRAGQDTPQTLTLPALEPDPAAIGRLEPSSAMLDGRTQKNRHSATPKIIVAGIGATGLVLGSVAGMAAWNAKTDLDALCPGRVCSKRNFEDVDRYDTLRVVSSVGLVAGAVVLAGGVTWLLLDAPTGHGPRLSLALHSRQLVLEGQL